jgi:two-component system LytT family response regulator
LLISTASGELVIPVAEIDWISADDYYSCVHANAKDYLLRESLSSLEMRLDARRFVRVHRSAIVHLDRVRQLRTSFEGSEALLRDGSRVPVSRRKRRVLEGLLHRTACKYI